jgi:release factor glutamine methyltransferase
MNTVLKSLQQELHDLTYILLPVCHDLQDAQAEAWLLLQKVTGLSRAALLIRMNRPLLAGQLQILQELCIERVGQRKPLQYILGTVPFLDLTIVVKPPTLIPRPETEEWVAWLIQQYAHSKQKPLKILDLCTGSGCIALALAKAFPAALVVGVDIAPAAVALAQANAASNATTNVQFVCADLWAGVAKGEQFDLIVSNPPYITDVEFATLTPEVAQWEDKGALVAARNGLALYAAIAQKLIMHLDLKRGSFHNGRPLVVIELGADASAVRLLFEQAGALKWSLESDLQGRYRWLVGAI